MSAAATHSSASSSGSVVFDPALAFHTLDDVTSELTTLVVHVPQTITTLEVLSTWPPPEGYGDDPEEPSTAVATMYETVSQTVSTKTLPPQYSPSVIGTTLTSIRSEGPGKEATVTTLWPKGTETTELPGDSTPESSETTTENIPEPTISTTTSTSITVESTTETTEPSTTEEPQTTYETSTEENASSTQPEPTETDDDSSGGPPLGDASPAWWVVGLGLLSLGLQAFLTFPAAD